MSDVSADLRRVVSSTGIYALAAVAQRGVAFFLLPVYTRFIDPESFGLLELLNVFASVAFAILAVGMPSALNKVFHRDCETEEERERTLSTTLILAIPFLGIGSVLLWSHSPEISRVLLGVESGAHLVRLSIAGGLITALISIVLSSLRTREKAVAYSLLSMVQFTFALVLNIWLVVHQGLGILGVLWGNLLAGMIAFPVSLWIAARGTKFGFSTRLVRPLVGFGGLLVPVMIAGWVMDLSDRYLLRLFADLSEVAVYGVGYKIGMVIQLVLVWPFQLAWPAVSFSISQRGGHQETFSTTLTWLSALTAYLIVGLSLVSRSVIPWLVGDGYQEAFKVVPMVAIGYGMNGIHFCLSPGVHISGKTKYFPVLSGIAALLNILLNLVLIPRFGMYGAAWSTVAAFSLLALGTAAISQKFYPVTYQTARLFKVVVAASAAFLVGWPIPVGGGLVWTLTAILVSVLGMPVFLWMLGFFTASELEAIRGFKTLFGNRNGASADD